MKCVHTFTFIYYNLSFQSQLVLCDMYTLEFPQVAIKLVAIMHM